MVGGTTAPEDDSDVRFPESWSSTFSGEDSGARAPPRTSLSLTTPSLLSRGTLTSCGGLTKHGEGRATRPRYWGTAATILAVRLPLVTGQLKIHFCSGIKFSTTGVRSGAIPLVFTSG